MALEGTLRDISLEDLFDIFVSGHRSGRLLLLQGQEQGHISISRGRIADASLIRLPDRKVIATDTEAMIQICIWDDASFVFMHDSALDNQPIHIRASFADILKQAEIQRALAHIAIQVSDPLRLDGRPEMQNGMIELSRDEWYLLSALCNEKTVAEVSRDVGMTPSQALAIAKGMLQRGLLRRPSAEPVRSHTPQPTPIWPKRSTKATSAAPQTNGVLLRAIIKRVQNL
ncbi:MAG: DUF4388 domain-containing protein [Oscillochloris sp.]|nr:DUF4388 domain-containing protein [Oscillochloris sp.]